MRALSQSLPMYYTYTYSADIKLKLYSLLKLAVLITSILFIPSWSSSQSITTSVVGVDVEVDIDGSTNIARTKMTDRDPDATDAGDLRRVELPITWDALDASSRTSSGSRSISSSDDVLVGRASVPASYDSTTPVVAIFPNYAGLKGLEYDIARWWTAQTGAI